MRKSINYISTILSIIMILLLSIWVNPADTYYPVQPPKFRIVISAPTVDDDFIFEHLSKDIVISSIEGILQSGTSVTTTLQKCNSIGESCATMKADMVFNGGLDIYNFADMTDAYADSNQTLKFLTVSVSSPGYLIIIINYRLME